MNSKVSKAVILNKGTVSWFSKGSLHTHELPSLLNRSFLDFQLKALRGNGIDEIHLVMVGSDNGHQYENSGLIIHRQDEFKGTAGAILPLKEALNNEPFIILNASTFVSEFKLRLILSEFAGRGDDWGGTFAVFETPCELQYSETIKISKDSTIEGIYRSHRSQNRRSNTGLAGLYLLSPRCFEFIPENSFFDLKEQLLPLMIEQGLYIKAHYLNDGCSVLTTDAYLKMQFRLLRESLEEHIEPVEPIQLTTPELQGEAKIVGNVVFGTNCTLEKNVTIVGPVLFGNHCHIAENATIVGPAVIGNDCLFGAGSWVQASVLHDAVRVGELAQVRHCLLGEGHQVAATDTRNCVDALIDTSPEPQSHSMVDHEMPQTLHHYDMLANAYSIAKYQMKKRIFDILVASTLLILSLPVWVLIAIAIRLDSKGGIFYAQKRCGIHGKEFPMMKFRTMLQNAHQMQDALRHKLNEVDGPVFKMSNDPRLTRVGRLLRKTSLDELPQLINVLMGDMSCVGPRPLAIKEMTFNPHWRDLRLMVKPGLTGLWQVYSRDDPRFHAWIEKDIEYVRNQSIRRDIHILVNTIKSALQGV